MTKLTILEAAQALDNSEYREEGSRELFQRMKASRLVAVFGASDDLAELRGAIDDETGTSKFYLDRSGLLTSKCSEGEDCPYFKDSLWNAAWIKPVWGEFWTYETSIPHETFIVNEEGEPYCRGIVFSLDELEYS